MGIKSRQNAAKVRSLLIAREGSAVLYRTCIAGPSGQRCDVAVGRVTYAYDRTGQELEVSDPRTGEIAGYLSRSTSARHVGDWTVHSHSEEFADYEFNRLIGWTETVSLGADILVNGPHAATGRHDHARISQPRWAPYAPADIAAL